VTVYAVQHAVQLAASLTNKGEETRLLCWQAASGFDCICHVHIHTDHVRSAAKTLTLQIACPALLLLCPDHAVRQVLAAP
jgi:hypothetical protein